MRDVPVSAHSHASDSNSPVRSIAIEDYGSRSNGHNAASVHAPPETDADSERCSLATAANGVANAGHFALDGGSHSSTSERRDSPGETSQLAAAAAVPWPATDDPTAAAASASSRADENMEDEEAVLESVPLEPLRPQLASDATVH